MHQNHTLPIRTMKQDLATVEQLLGKCVDTQTEKYGIVLIVITEALANALIHGNKEDSSKNVLLTLCYETNQKIAEHELIHILTVIVTDEGASFDPDLVPNPTDDNYIHKEGGRGLFLMKELSDDITFHHTGNGNKVTMTFHIPVGVESEV